MHKNVEVLFEVDGVKKKLNSIIGAKQGALLGPELFTFYMSAVLETWRSLLSHDLCIMRSKEDFILTGRNHKRRVAKISTANGLPSLRYRTVNMRMTLQFHHSPPDQTLRFSHRCSWTIFEDGDSNFMQALIAPTKNPRHKFYLFCARPHSTSDLPR